MAFVESSCLMARSTAAWNCSGSLCEVRPVTWVTSFWHWGKKRDVCLLTGRDRRDPGLCVAREDGRTDAVDVGLCEETEGGGWPTLDAGL
jgi:hypothetical protein